MTTFHGIFTPLVTPIREDQSPDLESLSSLVEFQVRSGVHGLWAMGTSAEFAGFDAGERAAAVRTTVEAAAGRVPVIANVSDAATRLAIRHAEQAAAAGANAIAATPPYYYPHAQDELLAHYRALHAATGLPLFIYNIPQTVRVKVELATARALATDGTVVGIKDSQNDLEWFRQLTLFASRQNLQFSAFAGTRHLIDAAVLAGACGAIPSVANAFPTLCVETYEAAVRGDYATAGRLQSQIVDIETWHGAVPGGSRNAAVLGTLKHILATRGIIARAGLTAPLRNLSTEDGDAISRRAAAVDTSAPV